MSVRSKPRYPRNTLIDSCFSTSEIRLWRTTSNGAYASVFVSRHYELLDLQLKPRSITARRISSLQGKISISRIVLMSHSTHSILYVLMRPSLTQISLLIEHGVGHQWSENVIHLANSIKLSTDYTRMDSIVYYLLGSHGEASPWVTRFVGCTESPTFQPLGGITFDLLKLALCQ